MKPLRLVVSAPNITEGGPLTVLREFVAAASRVLPGQWRITVFAHHSGLLPEARPEVIEMPSARGSWLRRMWLEWYGYRSYARTLQPDLWVSLNDTSPSVGGIRQAVYCHNPAAFYRLRFQDVFFQPSLLLFKLAYRLIYRINLNRNCAIVVQQCWMRDAFQPWVRDSRKIIVAHPVETSRPSADTSLRKAGRTTFLYPALPRPFKNLDLVCRAVQLAERSQSWGSDVILTVDSTDNRYGKWLVSRFGHLKSVHFIGRQRHEDMQRVYEGAHCLLFLSRVETWGLPISEAKRHQLPMLVADLPYARETVGSYSRVEFVDVNDYAALAAKMLAFQKGELRFSSIQASQPEEPFAPDWESLIRKLISLPNSSGAT